MMPGNGGRPTMTLIELARIAARYETDMAHALMQAVAFAMYDPECAFPVGDERHAEQP